MQFPWYVVIPSTGSRGAEVFQYSSYPDALSAVDEMPSARGPFSSFDLVFGGYSLNHFDYTAKQRVFDRVHALDARELSVRLHVFHDAAREAVAFYRSCVDFYLTSFGVYRGNIVNTEGMLDKEDSIYERALFEGPNSPAWDVARLLAAGIEIQIAQDTSIGPYGRFETLGGLVRSIAEEGDARLNRWAYAISSTWRDAIRRLSQKPILDEPFLSPDDSLYVAQRWPEYFLLSAPSVSVDTVVEHYQPNLSNDQSVPDLIGSGFSAAASFFETFFESARFVAEKIDREHLDVFARRNHNFLLREAILSPDTPLHHHMHETTVALHAHASAATPEEATAAS